MNKNAQTSGDHEVHDKTCPWVPKPENQFDLGYHPTCHPAVALAKRYNPLADGCKHCSPDCHTR
ncbi:MAG: hypothetical protein ACOZE5_18245 [Verrucomicrobiota bacterium]